MDMVRRFLKISTVFFLLVFFFPLNTFAWNAIGHMVIANIAYQNLEPPVREKVDTLVSYFKQEYPYLNSLTQMATWPDLVRSQRIDTFTRWHYIDVPFSNDGTKLKNTISTDNAVWALHAVEMPLKNEHANNYERARFLAFLCHIVADLHQPLHTVTRISARYPDGDRGGNLYVVRHHSTRTELHAVWDQGLGALTGENSPKHVDQLTNEISSLYPQSYFGDRVNDLDPNHWTKEGMENAKGTVYNTPENMSMSDAYISAGQELAKQEVALAGYRLAAKLNALLG